MKYLKPVIYDDFKCIGSNCDLTCCARWNIYIDDVSLDYYRSVGGEFGERLNKGIVKYKNGAHAFAVRANGDCVFLDEKGLCDIYNNLGKDHLCKVCECFPRYSYVVGDIMFKGIDVACPEVVQKLFDYEKQMEFDYSEDGRLLKNENDIDWNSFNCAIKALTNNTDLAQNRFLVVRERVMLMTLFNYQFQSCIDEHQNPSGCVELFSNPQTYMDIIKKIVFSDNNIRGKLSFCFDAMRILTRIDSLEIKTPELYTLLRYYDTEGEIDLDEAKIITAYKLLDSPKEQIWQEQLLVYAIHHFYMQGFKNKQYYDYFIFGCFSTYLISTSLVMLYYFKWERMPDRKWLVMIVAQISRIVGHGNILEDPYFKEFKDKGLLGPEFLLQLQYIK